LDASAVGNDSRFSNLWSSARPDTARRAHNFNSRETPWRATSIQYVPACGFAQYQQRKRQFDPPPDGSLPSLAGGVFSPFPGPKLSNTARSERSIFRKLRAWHSLGRSETAATSTYWCTGGRTIRRFTHIDLVDPLVSQVDSNRSTRGLQLDSTVLPLSFALPTATTPRLRSFRGGPRTRTNGHDLTVVAESQFA